VQSTEGDHVWVEPTEWRHVALDRIAALTAPIPSTKGLGPKDRADRLHAELERRIALAKDAQRCLQRG
jgi:hypothetical protein